MRRRRAERGPMRRSWGTWRGAGGASGTPRRLGLPGAGRHGGLAAAVRPRAAIEEIAQVVALGGGRRVPRAAAVLEVGAVIGHAEDAADGPHEVGAQRRPAAGALDPRLLLSRPRHARSARRAPR